MARLEGITGGLSGKMGSAVFRQSGGKTIASQYQPIVKNPNSEGQQAQRAKFKLMSQLAAIMSRGFGSFIIKTRPEKGRSTQRNAFVQTNFPLVEVSEDNNSVSAKIPMEKLKLTSSFRQLPNFNNSETFAHTNQAHVFVQGIPSDVTTLRVVVVGYKGETAAEKQAYIERIADLPVDNGTVDDDIPDMPAKRIGDQVTMLAFGLIPSASAAKKIDLDNIHTPNDQNFISAIKLDQMVSDGQMTETVTIGINLTVTEA